MMINVARPICPSSSSFAKYSFVNDAAMRIPMDHIGIQATENGDGNEDDDDEATTNGKLATTIHKLQQLSAWLNSTREDI